MIRSNRDLLLNCMFANDTFNAFLLTLKFYDDNELNNLFSCSYCEKTLPDGSNRFDGIIMDSTAKRNLGKLPDFQLTKMVVESDKRIAEK